jgi:hypothetical protein
VPGGEPGDLSLPDGAPAGHTISGTWLPPSFGDPVVLLVNDQPQGPDLLAQGTAQGLTIIGPTGRADLRAIAADSAGTLYALGSEGGGALYTLNRATGAAMLVGGQGSYGQDTRALTVLPDGRLLAAGTGLRWVDPATGIATPIGPTGAAAAVVGMVVARETCYANCDTGGTPILNVGDFTCFLQLFAAGYYYGNCDRSTTPPTLNIADFTCFLQRFAAGCQ